MRALAPPRTPHARIALLLLATARGRRRRELRLAVLGAGPVERREPNIVVVLTDDQTVAELATMPNTRALDRGQGVRFDRIVCLLSGLLSVAGDVPDRPVRAQPRRHGPLPAHRRLRAL